MCGGGSKNRKTSADDQAKVSNQPRLRQERCNLMRVLLMRNDDDVLIGEVTHDLSEG